MDQDLACAKVCKSIGGGNAPKSFMDPVAEKVGGKSPLQC